MKFLNDWLTGPDGITHDPARGLWILGIVAFLCFAGYEVYTKKAFDMVNFSISYSSLLGAGAAGVRIKANTEPAALPPQP